MAKFHINSKGEARQCRASKVTCKFEHFDTMEQAEAHAQEQMKKRYEEHSKGIRRAPKKENGLQKLARSGVSVETIDSVADHDFSPHNAPGESTVDLVDEKPTPEMLSAIRSGKLSYSSL